VAGTRTARIQPMKAMVGRIDPGQGSGRLRRLSAIPAATRSQGCWRAPVSVRERA
jgi:hypothetical protein